MWDACVVIDGSLSYAFNDGAELDLSMHAEDALKCIKILPGPGDPWKTNGQGFFSNICEKIVSKIWGLGYRTLSE